MYRTKALQDVNVTKCLSYKTSNVTKHSISQNIQYHKTSSVRLHRCDAQRNINHQTYGPTPWGVKTMPKTSSWSLGVAWTIDIASYMALSRSIFFLRQNGLLGIKSSSWNTSVRWRSTSRYVYIWCHLYLNVCTHNLMFCDIIHSVTLDFFGNLCCIMLRYGHLLAFSWSSNMVLAD